MKKVNIYCIEDINDLKYVGSTTSKLNQRLTEHKSAKNIKDYNCSSQKLNLEYCIIYELETCNESNRLERERYWINKIDCVNERKLNFNKKEYQKEYHKEYHKEYYKNNKEKRKEQMKEFYKNNKDYKKEYDLFRRRSFVKSCYQFIKMLEQY
jgi:hypothetical protein